MCCSERPNSAISSGNDKIPITFIGTALSPKAKSSSVSDRTIAFKIKCCSWCRAEFLTLLSFIKNNNDLCRCHLCRVCLPPKTFCDLNCLVTTTEIPISQKCHIQATGGWAQGQVQVWMPREWYLKDSSYQQSWDTNFFQITRWEDVQCIFWLSRALFPRKSASPVQLNLEEKRHVVFSDKLLDQFRKKK